MIARIARLGATILGVLGAAVVVTACFEVAAAYAYSAWLPATIAPASATGVRVAPRLIALGDSLAAGYGAPRGSGWVDNLRRRLSARAPDSTVVNVAVRGARVPNVLAQIDRIGPSDADAVFLVAGTNDVLCLIDPLTLARDEDAVLRRIRVQYPRAAIVVANVPDVSRTNFRLLLPGSPRPTGLALLAFQWWNGLDNLVIERVARRFGAHVVDLRRALPGDNPASNLSADGFHPNARGYAILADLAWPEIARALGVRR